MDRPLPTLIATLALLAPHLAGCHTPANPTPTDQPPMADATVSPDAGTALDAPACTPGEAASEPVSVMGELGTLGGTLEVPAGCPPFPLAVLVSGSGSTDRDGNDPYAGGPDEYRMLSLALRDAGVATLRYDDHGIGESTGAAPATVEAFRFDLEFGDAGRWIAQSRADGRFDRVLFAGHSQGSLTSLIAAQSEPVDGVISLDGTSLPAGRLLIEQARSHLTADDLAALEHAVDELEAGRTVDDLPARVAPVLPVSVQPYLISWFRFNPLVEITATDFPVLVVHGTTDQLVPIEHASSLKDARAGTELAIIEGMAHSLKQAGADRMSQDLARTDPSVPLAEGLVERIASFALALPAP